MRVVPVASSGKSVPPEVLRRDAADRIQQLKYLALSRQNILRVIEEPSLDLYGTEAKQLSWEDVADQIKDDFQVYLLADGSTFRVSFAYRDRQKAQDALRELIATFPPSNAALDQGRADNWAARWSQPVPIREQVDVLEAPALPTESAWARRGFFAACGTAGGLILGAMLVFFWRLPRFALRVAACGIAGCAVAFGLSFLVAERYTARAVLRITAPIDPAHLSGSERAVPVSEWVARLRHEIMDGDLLLSTLRMPKLGFDAATIPALYRNRRREFGIQMVAPFTKSIGPAFEITFNSFDPQKARAVVAELVAEVNARYIADRELSPSAERIQIVDRPTLESETVTHYHLQIVIAGAVMGILLAAARWSGDLYRTTSLKGESSLSL